MTLVRFPRPRSIPHQEEHMLYHANGNPFQLLKVPHRFVSLKLTGKTGATWCNGRICVGGAQYRPTAILGPRADSHALTPRGAGKPAKFVLSLQWQGPRHVNNLVHHTCAAIEQ